LQNPDAGTDCGSAAALWQPFDISGVKKTPGQVIKIKSQKNKIPEK
jgi:hypothetical protein